MGASSLCFEQERQRKNGIQNYIQNNDESIIEKKNYSINYDSSLNKKKTIFLKRFITKDILT